MCYTSKPHVQCITTRLGIVLHDSYAVAQSQIDNVKMQWCDCIVSRSVSHFPDYFLFWFGWMPFRYGLTVVTFNKQVLTKWTFKFMWLLFTIRLVLPLICIPISACWEGNSGIYCPDPTEPLYQTQHYHPLKLTFATFLSTVIKVSRIKCVKSGLDIKLINVS